MFAAVNTDQTISQISNAKDIIEQGLRKHVNVIISILLRGSALAYYKRKYIFFLNECYMHHKLYLIYSQHTDSSVTALLYSHDTPPISYYSHSIFSMSNPVSAVSITMTLFPVS